MSRLSANILLLLAAALWGAGNVSQKTILDHLGPFTAVALRCLIGAVVVLPFCWREFIDQRGGAGRRSWWPALTIAILFTLAIALQQCAYGSTSVTNASILVNTTVVMTPLAGWLLLGERPALMVALAATVAFAGAYLLGGGSPASLQPGDLICLASAAVYSIWIIVVGVWARLGDAGSVIPQFLAAGLVCGLLGVALEPISLQMLQAALPDLIVLGVMATGAPYAIQALAQRYTPANDAAVVMSAEGVFGAAAGGLMLGERLGPVETCGAIIILISVGLVQVPGYWPFAARAVPQSEDSR